MNRIALAAAVVTTTLVAYAPDARACGGCFHPPTTQNASVITDHRMALSVSTTQTVLWDQVRYSGDPAEFAWVLPVGQAAYIELARDEWLSALDAISAPTISAPPLPARCSNVNSGGGGIGCGAADNAAFAADGSAADAGVGVTVVSQNVVGPYLAVKIRSSSGEAITTWLTANGYAIPPSTQPILDAYTKEGFDFIALKLAPNQGVNAMQPVRVVTPGADPTLPLRMVAAGIGQSVGLTLFIIGEGRYDSSNFTNATIDATKLLWNPTSFQSNYADLFTAATAAGNTWVTEFSGPPGQLAQLYKSSCFTQPNVAQPCADDGGADAATEASVDDAGDAQVSDAQASDAQASDGSTCVTYVPACTEFTDWDVASAGLAPYDVRITRLRTTLPATALAVDLKLEAAADQAMLSNLYTAAGYTDPSYDPCPGVKSGSGCDVAGDRGTALVSTSLGVIALASLARRRRRAR